MSKTKVIIDDVEESAIIDVEIRPIGDPYPAVAFNHDEEAELIRVAIASSEDDLRTLTIPADAFWLATLALSRDNLTTELEALTSGSIDK